ncbi:unnamed protein product [Urochloa humidicola]
MNHTWTHQAEATRSTHLLKIHSFYSVNKDSVYCSKPGWKVGGYEWEIRFYPHRHRYDGCYYMELVLIFHGEAGANSVKVSLSCRLVRPSGARGPSAEKVSAPTQFQRPSDSSQPFLFMRRDDVCASDFLQGDGSLTVECGITVFKDLYAITVPTSNLPQHLGELLASKAGSDITFIVSGKSFAAHKNVLAARSSVFKAEFFGGMKEKCLGRVEIKEIDPSVFEAMLRFIYTDGEVPELDDENPEAATLAQQLLAAADRYGLDRLKVMYERMLAYAMDSSTAATTLALAERHGCSQLKAKCIEFIAGGSRENLDAVLETEGFKELEASTPSVVTEILRAAHGRKN